ncbi:MAG TPA: AI-2E family transporter [Arenimonas sp.]|nr:AI-2E family transporter [Arenimonas sp.]
MDNSDLRSTDPADGSPSAVRDHGSPRLTTLTLLAAVAACWLAAELLIPVFLAAFLALLANPLVSQLQRLWVPRALGGAALIVGVLVTTAMLGSLLIAPAAAWMEKAPSALAQIAPRVTSMVSRIDQVNRATASIANAGSANSAASDNAAALAARPQPPNLWRLVLGTPRMLASILAVALLAYFFLLYGERLQRHAVALLRESRQQRLAFDILRTMATDVSKYFATISVINGLLGLLLAAALWWLGLDLADALLWGTFGALLNYIPYIGPFVGVAALALMGIITFDTPLQMLLPAAIYLGLQVLESEFFTPIMLGRRLALSPLVMLLWLMLWGFLWGIAGVLLAMPMLMCMKIVADRVDGGQRWARVIE